jgi:tripeptidyl-peptidase-1
VDESPHAGFKEPVHRAHHFSLPDEVAPHVSTVFNTVQSLPVIPVQYHRMAGEPHREDFQPNLRRAKDALFTAQEKASSSQRLTTVAYLNEYYGIPSNIGNASLSQSVFEMSNEYFSQKDLTLFQKTFDLTKEKAGVIGGHKHNNCGNSDKDDCVEGNLDVQYIAGVAQVTATIFWHVAGRRADSYVSWITEVADEENPPQSNSMSWGGYEFVVAPSVLEQFNTEAMKLAAAGVTITVSTGDYGVSNFACLCDYPSGSARSPWTGSNKWTGTGYFPSFPATSPYVTAVGATMGRGGYPPAIGEPEIACQSQHGGVITSGGGFSTYYKVPHWQSAFTSSYLSTSTAREGYNPHGRGIPDLSFVGVYYDVMIAGSLEPIFGTSCSAPVAAALISLVKAARAAAGKVSVGFLNPTLYANSVRYR